jgi:hypothetical protein
MKAEAPDELSAAALLIVVLAAAPTLSQNPTQCVVSGSPPAGWGFNSIGYIVIGSGESCVFSVNVTGEILSSSVSQNPQHGTLQQLDTSSLYIRRWRDTAEVIRSPFRRPARARQVPEPRWSLSTPPYNSS